MPRGAGDDLAPCPTCGAGACLNCGDVYHLSAACAAESAEASWCPEGQIAAQQRDLELDAPEGADVVRSEAGELDLVQADTGLEEVPEDEWQKWAAAENTALDQWFAFNRQRSSFLSPTPAQWLAFTKLRLDHFPPPTRLIARPAARRAPVRDGRTRRPGGHSPKQTRGPPEDADPHLAPAAATLVRTAAAGLVIYAASRRHAVASSRVVRDAIRDGRGGHRG